MLENLRWLGLETARPGSARAFYDALGLTRGGPDPARRSGRDDVAGGDGDDGGGARNGGDDDARDGDGDVGDGHGGALVYRVGGDPPARLVLRRPRSVPRGGVHTHYALSVPTDEYDDWYDRLAADHHVAEHDFGVMRSVYVDDPDGHCLELAGVDVPGPGIDGVFEVVLEVRDLARARSFYGALGYEPTDEGDDRVRLSGPGTTPDLELWEPRLGIAGARGGLHVDLGFAASDPGAAARAVADRARGVAGPGDGDGEDGDSGDVRVVDPDGHHLTLLSGGD